MSNTLQNILMAVLSVVVIATQAGVLIWFFRKLGTLTEHHESLRTRAKERLRGKA